MTEGKRGRRHQLPQTITNAERIAAIRSLMPTRPRDEEGNQLPYRSLPFNRIADLLDMNEELLTENLALREQLESVKCVSSSPNPTSNESPG